MTTEERLEKIEKNQFAMSANMTILNDQMIVHSRMQEEMEKRWMDRADEMFAAVGAIAKSQSLTIEAVDSLRQVVENINTVVDRLGTVVSHLSAVVDHIASRIEELADKQANTQSALDALIATVDKFIKGSGNGQH